ncbi:hypothetical protein B6U66_00315 [Candidatus Bathyarchaeota archaeon ex4484_135]|nr:MAG: hypothetical protein B6U66_00315 [Candidatus Bathyarchaeota archaeon ex4484_135]
MAWISLILLFLLGLSVTTLASMVGLAGGTVISPVLIMGFGLEPRFAIGATVLSVFLAIISASLAYMREGRVDYKLALLFDALDVAGVAVGAYATVVLRPELLALALGVFLLYSGLRNIRRAIWGTGWDGPVTGVERGRTLWTGHIIDREGRCFTYALGPREVVLAVVGSFFSGLVSGMLGLGGGLVDLSLMLMVGIPFEVAVATATFGMLLTRASSIAAHAILGNIRPDVAIPLGVGAFLGGQIGPRLSGRVSPRLLKACLSFLAFFLGLALLLQALRALFIVRPW